MRVSGRMMVIFCMAGFFGGIIGANTLCRDQILTADFFDTFLYDQYLHTDIIPGDLFWYLIPSRVLPVILLILIAQVGRLRKAAVIFILVWTCFLSGIFFTAAVMRMGSSGILFCIISVLPHIIFYAAGYGILLRCVFLYPNVRWNATKMFAIILTISAGMILECYINPIFLKIFVKMI